MQALLAVENYRPLLQVKQLLDAPKHVSQLSEHSRFIILLVYYDIIFEERCYLL